MKQIFINIPVNDLEKSQSFYLALGFIFNPLFSDEEQICLVWSDSIYVMLQSRHFANSYLNKTYVDARKHQMPSFTLPLESMDKVNELMEKGLKAGGTEPTATLQEEFMYLRSIEDVDGYVWGIMCLDIERFKTMKYVDNS